MCASTSASQLPTSPPSFMLMHPGQAIGDDVSSRRGRDQLEVRGLPEAGLDKGAAWSDRDRARLVRA